MEHIIGVEGRWGFLGGYDCSAFREPSQTWCIIEKKDKVLVVEDQEMARNMTETMIMRQGFKVLVANDWVEAIEIFQNHRDQITAILSSLAIPQMDGWETLSVMRWNRPYITIVLASWSWRLKGNY